MAQLPLSVELKANFLSSSASRTSVKNSSYPSSHAVAGSAEWTRWQTEALEIDPIVAERARIHAWSQSNVAIGHQGGWKESSISSEALSPADNDHIVAEHRRLEAWNQDNGVVGEEDEGLDSVDAGGGNETELAMLQLEPTRLDETASPRVLRDSSDSLS